MKSKYLFLSIISLLGFNGYALSSSNAENSELMALMPARVRGADASNVNMDLFETSFSEHLKSEKYTIVRFLSLDGICEIIVARKVGKHYVQMGQTKLKFQNELDGCAFLEMKDLDGDGRLEVVVNTMDGDKDEGSPAFLKWDGKRLVDISPVKTIDGKMSRDFRSVAISSGTDKGKLVIYDYNPDDSAAGKRVFEMINGDVRLVGSYDLVTFIPSSGERSISPTFPSEGQYTLTVKNISDHNRPVRAEVSVNGSVVLKPQDFCSAPAHAKNDKKWWRGNDDDDDRDDDHCKRCIPKNGAYAIVNMKTANEIKVKVYGRKDSKIQLALVKK